MTGNCSVCDTCGGGAHQHFNVGVVFLNQTSQTVFYVVADINIGQRQTVVGVNRALNAARPSEGLVGAEKYSLDFQQILCNEGMQFHEKFLHISLKYFINTINLLLRRISQQSCERRLNLFFPGACITEKTLLTLQTCEQSECAAAGCLPIAFGGGNNQSKSIGL